MSDEKTIVLCPGQGAQHVGMGKAWASAHKVAADIYAQADAELGTAISDICFNGPEDRINRTDIAQAAIYTTSIACWRTLESLGKVGPISAAGGLSLGEYTALHLAGVFGFIDGLRLVWQRGRFMQEAAEASRSGMVALIGADESQAEAICTAQAQGQVLVAANFNCPGQIVISGHLEACDRALAAAEASGIRATKLAVAGAFHSPLMQPAADRMAAALEKVNFSPPGVVVMSNVTGKPHGADVGQIRRLLVEQITGAVRWESDCRHLLEHHPGRYVEPAPGKTLMGLMRRIERKARVDNFAEPE